jgi:hypothetical protein
MAVNEILNIEIVSERLKEFISPDYQWPVMPVGWQLEFIVYPDGEVDMDFCHSVSRAFWSESNNFLELPKMMDGSVISVDVLKNAGIPFMTTFGQAKESDLPIESHLNLVK